MLMKSLEIDIFENLNLARLPIPPRGQPVFSTALALFQDFIFALYPGFVSRIFNL
jgi:hypothetical protein